MAPSPDFSSTISVPLTSRGETVRLPRAGTSLLCLFLTTRERENLMGDLAEEYQAVLSAFGHRKAAWWFYEQVFYSLLPLTCRSLTRVTLLDLVRRLLDR